jgi:hypothetical protein
MYKIYLAYKLDFETLADIVLLDHSIGQNSSDARRKKNVCPRKSYVDR